MGLPKPHECCGLSLPESCCRVIVDRDSYAEALREAGMAGADSAEKPSWKRRADQAIRQLARSGRPFTAEDVRRKAGSPSRPNALGARMFEWARRGLIRRVGTVKANRSDRRKGTLGQWVGAGASHSHEGRPHPEAEQQELG